MKLTTHALKKQDKRLHHNPNYKRPLPGPESYHIPLTRSHESPCMDSFWRSQPIRQGNKIEEKVI